MAFHGSWLEEVTDDIASAAAERSEPRTTEFCKGPDDQWHIPSHLVSPDESRNLKLSLTM